MFYVFMYFMVSPASLQIFVSRVLDAKHFCNRLCFFLPRPSPIPLFLFLFINFFYLRQYVDTCECMHNRYLRPPTRWLLFLLVRVQQYHEYNWCGCGYGRGAQPFCDKGKSLQNKKSRPSSVAFYKTFSLRIYGTIFRHELTSTD